MQSLLFHKDVFMPEGVQSIVKNHQKSMKGYRLSEHFKSHIDNQEDRSHTYIESVIESCLATLPSNPQEAFEVEVTKDDNVYGILGWVVTKFCCRIPYDNYQDLVVVIRPQFNKHTMTFKPNDYLVVTAWMNAHLDSHTTLDPTKYCTEKDWNELNGK
jgi:hypothetical protein